MWKAQRLVDSLVGSEVGLRGPRFAHRSSSASSRAWASTMRQRTCGRSSRVEGTSRARSNGCSPTSADQVAPSYTPCFSSAVNKLAAALPYTFFVHSKFKAADRLPFVRSLAADRLPQQWRTILLLAMSQDGEGTLGCGWPQPSFATSSSLSRHRSSPSAASCARALVFAIEAIGMK